VEARTVSIALSSAYHFLWKRHAAAPLGIRIAPSRFTDGRSHGIVYAAPEFDTAFIEVVVRDRFVKKASREIPIAELDVRCWVRFATRTGETLSLLDLRGSGCVDIGAPTDAVKARNHASGRTLGSAIYTDHPKIDGFVYPSRLTGADCYAIFDRGVHKLIASDYGTLIGHDALPDLLLKHGLRLAVGS
jgi:hypothetical protein